MIAAACAAIGAAACLVPRSADLEPRRAPPRAPIFAGACRVRPLAFERNDGQTDPRVAFVARGAGGAVFVGKDGLTVRPRGVGRAPLRMTFDGAEASRVDGVALLPGHVNYIKGNDPTRWLKEVPLYARAVCRGVWPGIDVVFRGDGRDLEYDFDVAPGADPSAIALRFDGADSVAADATGDLVVRVGDDAFKNVKPRAFQDGREVAGAFVARGDGRVGFEVPGRDPSRALVIDPVVAYATYIGGEGDETPSDATVDFAGDVYVTGSVVSIDFPVVNGLPGSPGGAGVDAFVTKINASGAKFLYSTYLGGAGNDAAWGIRSDTTGIYVAGSTTSPDFPAVNAYQSTMKGGTTEGDAFLIKLNTTGDGVVYSTYLGGAGDDGCRALAVDAVAQCTIAGFTDSADFPTTLGVAQPTMHGAGDGWVARFSANGAALSWCTYLGGSSGSDAVQGLASDLAGNVFACGYTGSNDFPVTSGAFQKLRGGGNIDGFLVKLDSHGTVAAGTFFGGALDENCRRVAVDTSGNAYVAGFALSNDLPTVNAVQSFNQGGIGTGDGFVAEFDSALTAPVFATYFGGTDDDDVQGLAVGKDGSVYIAGNTKSTYFPLLSPAQATFGGVRDAFVAKLAPSGASLTWATYFGGTGYDAATAVAVDSAGSAYVAVATQSSDVATFCAAQAAFGGGRSDVCVAKFSDDAPGVPATPLAPTATATSAYRIDFSWTDASNDECSFRVERSVAGGPFATIGTTDTNVTTIADVDVAPDTTYSYRVFAANPLGESPPSDTATVSAPETIVVSPRKGALVQSTKRRGDSIKISALLRFDQHSSDGEFALPANALEIAIGAQDAPYVISIPALDKGWKRRKNVLTWTSPKKTKPVVRVVVALDPVSPTLTVQASRLDFPKDPDGAVSISLRTGPDAGHVERAWTPLKKKPGRFSLP